MTSSAARRWPASSRSATVTDASGNVLDLKNLRPDGTIGEPVDETGSADASDGASEGADEAAEEPTED